MSTSATIGTDSRIIAITEAVLARGGQRERDEIRFRCVAEDHADEHPSARWNPVKKVWCCDPCDVGGGWRDLEQRLGLAPQRRSTAARCKPKLGPIVATYDYCDEHGAVLFQVVRFAPKTFRQRQPKDADWSWKMDGVRRVLYRLPELLAGDLTTTVFIAEGEKDADALVKLGLLATTNVSGAGKWHAK
jgi:hypothetical protein